MMNYKKVILYYFTGTGNALKAGRWICNEANKNKIKTILQPIEKTNKTSFDEIDNDTLIGFLSPTHGFNLAPAMLKFIFRFPSQTKADIFILNTRGGLKLFKYFLPGISGTAQFLPMIILKAKGYKVMGGLPLDMPSNWLFLHPGLNPPTVESIVRRCERLTKTFANKILSEQKVFRKMLVSLPVDIALLPIAFMYYIFARFILSKTMIYTNSCNNCKICADNCPVNAIKIRNGRPYWTFSCEGCMRCVNICPRTAIQTSHLIFALILIISSLSFNYIFFNLIQLPQFLDHVLILKMIKIAITLIELFAIYAIIQWLLKYKLISHVFKYTSLSTYWRRYRAPGISLNDFKGRNIYSNKSTSPKK